MADAKISQLPVASTPLAGTELVPVVQGGATEQTTVEAILTGTVPSGTANGVLYLNGSKVVTSGSALTFDGSTFSNVQGSGTSALSFNQLSFSRNGANYLTATLSSLNYGASQHIFGNNDLSSEWMRLTSTGLGIGTNNPVNPLNIVRDNTAFRGQLSLQTVSASNFAQLTFYDQTTLSGQIYQAYGVDKVINIVNPLAHGIAFWTTNTERMRLDSSGNLGLGVTPSASWTGGANLQIGLGAVYANSSLGACDVSYNSVRTASNSYVYAQTGLNATRLQQRDGAFNFFTALSGTAGDPISFTQAMTLDASGNLLVGKTSSSGGTAGIELAPAGQVIATRSGGAAGYFNRLTSDGSLISMNRSNTEVGSISVTTTATAYNTSSDYRLKNITGPITTSGAYIDSLNPVEGTWKADGSTFVGLIAHEVQEASRTTVATGVKDGEEMQGMDYSSAEIIANLIAEVKALRTRVAKLEAK
jgi:hypothetical protein